MCACECIYRNGLGDLIWFKKLLESMGEMALEASAA